MSFTTAMWLVGMIPTILPLIDAAGRVRSSIETMRWFGRGVWWLRWGGSSSETTVEDIEQQPWVVLANEAVDEGGIRIELPLSAG